MIEFLSKIDYSQWYVPDFVLGLAVLIVVFFGICLIYDAKTMLRKFFGMLILGLGVAGGVWLGLAISTPWEFSDPIKVPLVEHMGQQLLLFPETVGSDDAAIVNVNRQFGKVFPKDAVFIIDYRVQRPTCRKVYFLLPNKTASPYVVHEPVQKKSDKKEPQK